VDQDPIAARKDTEDVVIELEHAVEANKDRKIMTAELQKKLVEARQFYDSISGKEEVDKLPTFYDLRYVQSNFLATKIDLVSNTLIFLDQAEKKVIAVNIDNKQYTDLPLGDLTSIRDIDAEGRTLYLLGDGMFEFNLAEPQSATQIRASEDQNQQADFIRFFNQYIYVLNEEKRNIFRYAFGEDKKLGDSAGWVKSGTSIDFDQVNSMAIDGDIWLARKDGQIKKYTSGKEVAFTISGMSENFDSPISLYTAEDMSNLYILEPAKGRVVILDKEGRFLREVKSSSLRSTTALVASEKLKKVFAVSGSLVFEIDL
jgi:hypothetical protein